MKKIFVFILVFVLTIFPLTSYAFADDGGYDFKEWTDDQMEDLYSQVKAELHKRGLFIKSDSTDADISCRSCGKSIPSYSKFCPYCGNSQKQTISTPAVSSAVKGATRGEQNALASAQNYLNFTAFSYSSLVKQLKYEGYSEAEATFAADHCGANWNEQAVKSAANYLNLMPFSRSGLIEQLEYEGFTYEQAVYGVDQNGY